MKIQQLTFTRFLAAIAIVIFHYGQTKTPFNHSFLSFIFSQAYVGVSYFFILSGFVMTVAYNKNLKIDYWDYYKNRFARIYPVYLLALLASLALLLFISIPIHSSELILSILLLQSFIPGYALVLNITGWTLSVELLFYLLFPFLFNYYKKERIKSIYIFGLMVWIVSQCVTLFFSTIFPLETNPTASEVILYSPFIHLNEFIVGNLAGIYFMTYCYTRRKNYDLLIIIILILLMACLYASDAFGFKYGIYHNGLLAVLFIPLILLLSLNTGYFERLFSHKLLVLLGESSYAIYILQFPVFSLTFYIMNILHIQNGDFIFYFSLLALILISILCFIFIETPIRNFIKGFHKKEAV